MGQAEEEALAPYELTEEEVRALRGFVAEEVLKRIVQRFGGVSGTTVTVTDKPLLPTVAVATVVGDTNGLIKVTLLRSVDHVLDSITLVYWLLEAKRSPSGLKVSVAIEPERKEGIMFTVEGVIPSGKVQGL